MQEIWIGSANGFYYVISDKLEDMPEGCRPTKLINPTEESIELLRRYGYKVDVRVSIGGSNETFTK